jgi:DNA uptake protein ComE-like DNA-binding protein
MKKILVGLAIGIPAAILLAQRRQAIVRVVRPLLTPERRPDGEGDRVAAAVSRVAERAREAGGNRNEKAMTDVVLNRVTREELLAVYGIGPALAERILDGRPYGNNHEVVEKGILNEQIFERLNEQVLMNYRKSA